MRQDIITQAVPNADPEFLRTLERLSDPPPGVYERVMKVLPRLHEIFLQKRNASLRGDAEAFRKFIEQEVDLIAQV